MLRKKLVAEKKVRKASEHWLKAELKSRVCFSTCRAVRSGYLPLLYCNLAAWTMQEDLEGLFATVREMALKQQNPEDGADRIKHIVENLRTRVKKECGAC